MDDLSRNGVDDPLATRTGAARANGVSASSDTEGSPDNGKNGQAGEGEQRDRRSVGERREQLVDATIEVLAEEGLARATTRRITDQAGLALGAFHYAFRSKDELLQAVIERVSTEVEGVLQDAGDQPMEDINEAVSSIVTGFWEFIEQSPRLQLAAYELTLHALREPALRDLAVKQYDRYTEAVAAAIDRVPGAPTGQQRDDLARYVMATIDGLVLHSFVDDDGPDGAQRRLEMCLQAVDNVLSEDSPIAV